ncbi:hypothetical protein ACMX2H_01045 [Arthrobacter sulfonylureivorans]|uniref:hypothetical protein n=1 Tax=Arthrobacter sulfonylureivorans TaxID=2486855 RepID=UPI0039E3CC7C
MRFKISVALMVIGLLAIALGIAQRTVWAPPERASASYTAEGTAPVTVIEPEVFGVHEEVDISVEADGEFLMAIGRAGDVDAWVGEAAHTSLTGIEDGQLQGTVTEGEAKVPNPAGSDLWVSEEQGEGSMEHRWVAPADGEWSILLASDGSAPAPTNVTVTWPNDTSVPWSLALIILGALLVVLGVAMAVVSRRPNRQTPNNDSPGTGSGSGGGTDKRAVAGPATAPLAATDAAKPGRADEATTAGPGAENPAEGSRPSGRPSLMVRPALGLRAAAAAGTAVVLAAGATMPAQAAPSQEAEEAAGFPVVQESQLTRIMDSVAASVSEADKARDAGKLKPRVGGAALTVREANYTVRAENGKAQAPVPVAAGPILTSMVSTSTEWPRTVVTVTEGEDNPVPQVIVLTQQDPRSNYRMVGAMQMLPGTTFPQVSTEGGGTPAVPLDAKDGLLYSPQAAVKMVAENLDSGKHQGKIGKNTFSDQIQKIQKDQVKSNKSADISFRRSVDNKSLSALRTADGGAVVFGHIKSVTRSVPAEAGATVELSPEFAALAGDDSTTEGVDVTYSEAVFLYVPPAESDETVNLVGVAQGLVDAKLK